MENEREAKAIAFYDGQKKFYSARAATNKRRYDISQLVVIIGGIAVPVLLAIPAFAATGAPLIISLIVAITAAAERHFRFGELWVSYRETAETLRRERILFDTAAGPYRKSSDLVALFAERVTSIVSAETIAWSTQQRANQSEQLEEVRRQLERNQQRLFRGSADLDLSPPPEQNPRP